MRKKSLQSALKAYTELLNFCNHGFALIECHKRAINTYTDEGICYYLNVELHDLGTSSYIQQYLRDNQLYGHGSYICKTIEMASTIEEAIEFTQTRINILTKLIAEI